VEAGEGTLFSMKIGEIPLEMQGPMILRALQEKEVRQVGGLRKFPSGAHHRR